MGGHGYGKLPRASVPFAGGVNTLKVSVVITAGGRGQRFAEGLPKQFVPLGGVPILERTIGIFESAGAVNEMVVSLPQEYADYQFTGKVRAVVPGGRDRQSSVYAALKAVDPGADIVLIHDGVRPLVTEEIINRIINCAGEGYAAIAGVKATDTIKQADADGLVTATPDRNGLWMVQTPQGFTYEVITQAHEMAKAEDFTGTDDGMLVERYALAKVKMVEGGRTNIKITTKFDLRLAEEYLRYI